MHGGYSIERASVLNDAWVLTIPGFHWFKTRSSTISHSPDSCNVVGKRQVISIGRFYGDLDHPSSKYGFGIFDLTDLRWKDAYDADADEYEMPEIVQEWYNNGYVTRQASRNHLVETDEFIQGPEGGQIGL